MFGFPKQKKSKTSLSDSLQHPAISKPFHFPKLTSSAPYLTVADPGFPREAGPNHKSRGDNLLCWAIFYSFSVADQRGFQRHAPPRLGQKMLIFMQFLGKVREIVGWRPPPLGLAQPPLGNPGSATESCMKMTKMGPPLDPLLLHVSVIHAGYNIFHYRPPPPTTHIRRMGKVMFSVCSLPGGGGKLELGYLPRQVKMGNTPGTPNQG